MGYPVILTYISRGTFHETWSRDGFFMCKLLMCFLYSVSARYMLKTGVGRRASENRF